VVAQRAERKLIEAGGERGWRERAVVWGKREYYRALTLNDGISDHFKKKSDGILEFDLRKDGITVRSSLQLSTQVANDRN
jgi:hypothetical protein